MGLPPAGFVTLPCREREVSAPQELSGRCDRGPPRGHRRSAKRAVRLGGDEMALDVEGGGVCVLWSLFEAEQFGAATGDMVTRCSIPGRRREDQSAPARTERFLSPSSAR